MSTFAEDASHADFIILRMGGKQRRVDIVEPKPDIEQLEAWARESGCYTSCGCWVEPDGVCEHGVPSWMMLLGFI